ncbi:MAG: 30S ribosomal protein S20 [Ignavibacteriales bacterium]|nr:30S ribosomal protein S20 [Ignavibacteriales bacterium]
MANHPSAVKAARQALRHREANRKKVSTLRTTLRKIRSAKTKPEGEALLTATVKMLDQYAAAGYVHKNKAANQKSKLTKFVKSLQ